MNIPRHGQRPVDDPGQALRTGAGVRLIAGVLALVGVLAFADAAIAITPTITEFSIGLTAGGEPTAITPGADANPWFLEYNSPGRIGRITSAGAASEVATGGVTAGFTANSQPDGIVAGPDGNLWFTEGKNPGRIGRINPTTGAVFEVATGGVSPGFTVNSGPEGIAAAPDGNLWFTETNPPGAIGRITPSGVVTEFTAGLTPGSDPNQIAAGPDGNLWFTNARTPARIGRITPAGVITEFTAGLTVSGGLDQIAAGPDGNLWFIESSPPGGIGRINPYTGVITQVATGGVTPGFTVKSDPVGIAAGPDGEMWFTEFNEPIGPGRIGRIDPATGAVGEFPTPTVGSAPDGIALGSDGNLWFTEFGASAIGRITTPPTAATLSGTATGPTAVVVSGTASGHAQATTFHVEYGPVGGATTTTTEQGLGTTSGDTPISAVLGGLTPNTAYQARVVVTNPTGTTPGAFVKFTTPATPKGFQPGTLAPTLTAASQSHATWREGNALAQISRRRKPPVGTTFTFTLNEVATVRMDFTQSTSGRRSGRKCVRPTRKNRRARKCTMTTIAGALSFTGHAGLDKLRFQGRISRSKKLKPGRYTLVITATGPTGAQSAPVKLSFTIVKG